MSVSCYQSVVCHRSVLSFVRSTQPCIPLGSLNRVPALTGWGKGGNFTSAGWQVTLCDPIWHVSSRSSEAFANCYTRLLYLLYFTINNTPMSVKLDTGTEWCVMSLKTFNTIPARPKIAQTDLLIRAYGMQEPANQLDKQPFDVAYCNHRLQVEFVIIDTGEATLLGLDACEQLGLVKIADAV